MGTETTAPPPRIIACSADPRSVRAHEAALAATRALLNEGGLPAATIEAISTRSGVSKMTIYKHWPSRAAVAAEAIGQTVAEHVAVEPSDDPLEDLRAHVHRMRAFYSTDNGTVVAQLVAACLTDSAAQPYVQEYVLDAHQQLVSELWRRAVDAGVVRREIDARTAEDLLFCPLLFRLLSGRGPLSTEEAEQIFSAAFDGLRHLPV